MNKDLEQELENALKFYLIGKKNVDTDTPKSLLYFKKSVKYIEDIKQKYNNINNKTLSIINTTEADCKKILTKSDNIFEIISKNDIYTIKKINYFNFREINDVGNTILHHCINTGDISILKELLKKGGNVDQVNGNGNTLLEYACLKKDPNIINFLINHGADLKKHLFFRGKEKHLYLNKPNIDSAIILKVILNNSKNNDNSLFTFLGNYFSWNELIGIEKYTIKDLSIGLTKMFKNKCSYEHYKNIIVEECENYIKTNNTNNVKKTFSKLDIVLFNLIPFISYPFINISNNYIIKNELKYLLKKIIKENNKNNIKEILLNKLFDIYIKTNLYKEDYIGILIYQLFNKITKINKNKINI